MTPLASEPQDAVAEMGRNEAVAFPFKGKVTVKT